MSFKVDYTPYDSVITVGDLTLSVSSEGKDSPDAVVKSSKCDYATLNVPLSLFEEGSNKQTFTLQDLCETQSWDDEGTCKTLISHGDMYKLQKYIKEQFRVRKVLNKRYKHYKTKRLLKQLILPFSK